MKAVRDVILISSITGLSRRFIIVPDRKIMIRIAHFVGQKYNLENA